MASDLAWQEGWQLGSGRAKERRERSDEEFLQRNKDLMSRRDALVQKLGTLKDANGNPLPGYDQTLSDLQSTIHDIGQHWHPDKNPGMIQRFGHVLTDKLGLTKPEDRIKKEADKRTEQGTSEEEEARDLASSAPASPAQQSKEKTQEDLASKKAGMDFVVDWAKNHGASESELAELTRTLSGLKISRLVPQGKPYKGQDGKYYQAMRDPDTNLITNTPMPEDYVPSEFNKPPSTSKFGQYEAAYRRDHNIPEGEALTVDELNYVSQQAALSSGIPSSNQTTTLKQDINGWWVPVTETNRHIPGIGKLLSDPRGQKTNTEAPKEGSAPSTAPKVAPKPATKKTTGKPAAPTTGSGSTRIGKPVLQGRTPEYTKAVEEYTAANKMAKLADTLQKQAKEHPEDMSEADGQFVLALIRSEAGRVNQQEIAQVFNAGGISEGPERWAAKFGHGQLSDTLRNQLVQFTHSLRDSSLESLNELKKNMSNGGEPETPAAGSTSELDDIIKGLSSLPK